MSVDYKAMIRAAVFTPTSKGWGLPLLIEGKPGSGKTSTIEAEAIKMGLGIETIIGSLREPQDFLGFPVPDGDSMKYVAPSWAKNLAKSGRGIAFFDELNTSAPAVQAALLRVILDGVVGDFKLPKGIRFIAAQNAVEDAAGGWDLAPPLANRFGHIEWEAPNVDSWSEWLLGNGVETPWEHTATEIEDEVEKQWPAAFAKAKGRVIGFLRRRPDLLMQMPKSNSPEASKAWPSPRSWENATRAMAGAEIHGLNEESSDTFVSSFIGAGAALEMAAWMQNEDLPDPVEVLDGTVKFKHDRYRLDRTAAVLSGCAALVVATHDDDKLQKARGAALWDILGGLCDEAADIIVGPAKTLVRARLTTGRSAKKALEALQPVLHAAG